MLTVYHGSTCRIEEPLAGVCRPNLDFGIGFYVTDLKEQAVRWALRTAEVRHKDEAWLDTYKCLTLQKGDLFLRSDLYILDEVIRELQDRQG